MERWSNQRERVQMLKIENRSLKLLVQKLRIENRDLKTLVDRLLGVK